MKQISVTLLASFLLLAGCGEEPVPRPELKDVNPAMLRPGQMISIVGANLGSNPPDKKVVLNGTESAEILSWSNSLVTAKIPPQMLGVIQVSLKIGADTTQSKEVTVQPWEPALNEMKPNRGWPGESAKISGQYLGTDKGKVLFGELEAKIHSWSETEIEVEVPEIKGDVEVKVVTSSGSEPKSILKYRQLVPVITKILPPGASEGAAVTLEGNYFGGEQGEVTVGDQKAAILSWDTKKIQFSVPPLPREGKSVPVKVAYKNSVSKPVELGLPQAPTTGPLTMLPKPSGPFNRVFIKKDGWPLLVHANEGNMFSAEWDGFGWVQHPMISDPIFERDISGQKVRLGFGYNAHWAMDSAGVVHASVPFHMDETVLYGRLENQVWKFELAVPKPPRSTGFTTDIVLDNQQKPVVAFYTEYFGLSLHRKEGAAWVSEVITPAGSADTVAGRVDMHIDATNQYHLVYFEGKRGELIYASGTKGQWKMMTLDSKEVAGAYASIAMDPLGRLTAAYQAKKTGDLRVVTVGEKGPQVETLDKGPNGGLDPCLTYDAQGNLHLVHHQNDPEKGGMVEYITGKDGAYRTQILMSGLGEKSSTPSLTFDPVGRLYIVHGDSKNQELMFYVIDRDQKLAEREHPKPTGTPAPTGPLPPQGPSQVASPAVPPPSPGSPVPPAPPVDPSPR